MSVQSDIAAYASSSAGGRDTGGPWHERARSVVAYGGFDPRLAAEAEHRADELTPKDLRMLLLVTGDHPGWLPARRRALAVAGGRPDGALRVLAAHCQVEVWPPPSYEESVERSPDGGVLHAAAVRIGPAGEVTTGPSRTGSSPDLARRAAADALLRALAGLGDAAEPRRRLPGMGTEVFESLLQVRVDGGAEPGDELQGELARRAAASRLRHRDVLVLLFDATGPGWRSVRERALDQTARMPPAAETLLRWQARRRTATLSPLTAPADRGFVSAWTWEEAGGETVTGPARTGDDPRTAQHRAAVALLARMGGLPEPQAPAATTGGTPRASARIQPVPQGMDPVKYLNKYTQLGLITKPESALSPSRKTVTCTYTCGHVASATTVRAGGTAKSKAEARRAGAAALMQKLVALDTRWAEEATAAPAASPTASSPAPPGPTDPSKAPEPPVVPRPGAVTLPRPRPGAVPPAGEGLSVETVVGEALAAGCALSFVPPAGGEPARMLLYRTDGLPMPEVPLPAPLVPSVRRLAVPGAGAPVRLAGWLLPVGRAVPVLLARGRISSWHPTAVEWEWVARLGARLVAAGLVHPALTPEGAARWRVGPLPADAVRAAGEFARHMSPHAHAVLAEGDTGASAGGGAGGGTQAVAEDGTWAGADAEDGTRAGMPASEAVLAFLHAVADGLVRTPAAAMFGSGAFLSPDGGLVPPADADAVRPWLDALDDLLDDGPPPGLVLDIRTPSEPTDEEVRLTCRLLIDPDPVLHPDRRGAAEASARPPEEEEGDDHLTGVDRHRLRERAGRRLERLARHCPVLAGLAAQPEALALDAQGIAQLLRAEEDLSTHGLRMRWPVRLREGLSAYAVVGTPPAASPAAAPAGAAPRFSLQALLDFRWQVALGDDGLSEAEMDSLAEAARPLVRIRGRWVLLAPALRARARNRRIGRLSGIEALTAALTGTVDVDGRQVACRAAGELADVVTALRRGENASPVAASPRLTAVLRGYQERALAWLAHTGALGFGAVLADDMGLGKTLTALAYALHRQEAGHRGPVLVVCPSSLVANWQREIGRFAPDLHVVRYHGPARSLDAVGERTVVLTTYGVLRQDRDLTVPAWDLVVADEAQHAKNGSSATARHLRALASTARLALSGTPVENNLSELWTLLDWTNPGLFGTLKAFRSRYAAAAERDPSGPAARALAGLVAPFLLRRTKADPGIAPELPAKVEVRRVVELTPEQVALYEAVVRETTAQIADSPATARSGLVLRLITALKQITNHPAHYLREPHPGPVGADLFAGRSAKLGALAELAGTIARRGESALVFTSYVAMGRLLQEHLEHLGHRPLFLHGGLDARRRQELVDAFQNGRTRLFVVSLRAGGTGLNLTRASHVVHFDRSWNAAVEDQASDRAHRIGQRRTVTVHRLVTRGTIEDRIDELLAHKRALQDSVLPAGDGFLGRLTDRELADLVRLGAPE
ncbi:DEAD/DEAH box helicase [Streptomyces sp. NPDC002262]|uniref:DEAD/DEAH box helicase n=1 Tax=Streptomyces sp. NPDC002262 TaxID=3154414 RepID=UPI00332D15CE